MILLHRLRGEPLHLNADLIESIESTPDTVVTLVDGRRVLIEEPPEVVVARVTAFRASLLVAADQLRSASPSLSVVPNLAPNDVRDGDEEGGSDPMFLIGIAIALLGIAVSTVMDGNAFAPLLGASSFVLVFLATIGAAAMSYRRQEVKTLPRSAVKAIKADVPDVQETITLLARLAETARRDGMLALEDRLGEIDDRFIALGVQHLVDGADEDVVRETLEIEINATDERHRSAIGLFKTLGSYAPTFGMVGTVIGLVNMLGNLADPSQLGRGMALALLTTLYGVILANLVFNPMAARLERLNDLELMAYDVALDGLLTIRRGASPRGVIERLESYLPPSDRIGVGDRLGGAASEAA